VRNLTRTPLTEGDSRASSIYPSTCIPKRKPMFNTLYDDDNHGLDLARLKKSQSRALRLCRRVGIKVTAEHIGTLSQKQLSVIIGNALAIIEKNLVDDWNRLSPEEREFETEKLARRSRSDRPFHSSRTSKSA
jgi:hypothetical protein